MEVSTKRSKGIVGEREGEEEHRMLASRICSILEWRILHSSRRILMSD